MFAVSFHHLFFLMLLFHIFHFTSSCKENEKKALLELKQNLTDPTGRLSSWKGEDCCRWNGVGCSSTKNVIKLSLPNASLTSSDKLSGEISSSLLELKYLNHLDLSINNFEGIQIPRFLGSLSRLRYLNLSGGSFSGRIPQTLAQLSGLQYLDLSSYTTESVENDLHWLPALSSLKYLNLKGLDLHTASSYWLEAVNSLPHLLELHLPECQLINLPPSLPSLNFTSLLVLDLSNNLFNSTLPNWLFNLTKLKSLDLNTNNLNGPLPKAFSELIFLEKLDLSSNFGLEGPFPSGLGALCNLQYLFLAQNKLTGGIKEFIDGLSNCSRRNLESLDLGYNEFNGNLPSSLGHLKGLRYLVLSANSFTGSIPETIGNLSSLEELYLSENQMSGNIPESFGQLKSLYAVDISRNSWNGVVTEAHLANLSSLQEIYIGKLSPNISLVFNISSNWIPPFKLKYIKIQGCQLGPKFPSLLRNQTGLQTIIINYAMISDVIPSWFLEMDLELNEFDVAYNQLRGEVPNMLRFSTGANVDLSSTSFGGPLPLWSSNLTTLYLRGSNFSGPIPQDIGKAMPHLTDLDMSRNNLTGTIPPSIGNMTELTTLVISSNNLHGQIPHFWANMPMLYIVDMSNNFLSGRIPTSIGFLSALRFLVLSSNNLSGEIPSSLSNCTDLFSMDLGNNILSGTIPPWIGAQMASSLLILSLRNNSFGGAIPSQICNLSVLHILDLSTNELSGPVPDCVGNLTGFRTDFTSDITEQYLGRLQLVAKGRQLQYDSILYLVNSVDLSINNLSGEIPQQITELFRLGTLNLSRNQLSGRIPTSMDRLERIETLDFSKNRLSGPIPQSLASLTFLNHLNLSYNNLSGQIPRGNQFETFIDPTIYEGNKFLCGGPLQRCNDSEIAPFPGEDVGGADDVDRFEKLWMFIAAGAGLFIGFWGVCGSLVVKKRWRDAYFGFVDRLLGWILQRISSNT